MEKERFFQVDFFKAFFIFIVILDHSIPFYLLEPLAPYFWERVTIPIFLIIMGFNMSMSFKRKGVTTLKDLYSKDYFKDRLSRFLIPYVVFYLASGIIFFIVHAIGFQLYYHPIRDDKILMLIGFTMFWGPGMWFIPIIFGSILIIPAIYYCFLKEPKLTLLLCFMSEFTVHLFAALILSIFPNPVLSYFFACCVLLYLFAIGMGFWFSKDKEITSKNNQFIWFLLPVSVIYIILFSCFNFNFFVFFLEYNIMYTPYPAFVFLIGMKFIPNNHQGKINAAIRKISNSTYHILLAQSLYFSIIYHLFPQFVHTGLLVYNGLFIIFLFVNFTISTLIGVGWYELEKLVREKRSLKKESINS